MRRSIIALSLVLAAPPAGAQLQTFASDPACSAGAVFTYVNSTTGVARKCVNGTISNVVAASEIETTGTLPPAIMPLPTSSTLGGAKSLAASANNFFTGLGTDGIFTRAQPAFSNLSGTASDAQVDGSLEADEVNPTLGTQTQGNYVASVSAGNGVAVTGSAGEGWTPTVALDYTDAGTDPGLNSEECRFSNEGASAGGWVCEGGTADTIETRFRVTDPTASDKVITFPNTTGTVVTTGDSATVTNGMLAGSITDANLASNYSGVGSCTNQVVTATVDNAGPTCTTLTSAYVNNSIALTGADINTSNQVTVTHLAAALPVAQGGTGVATHTQGAVITGGNGTAAEVDLADVAAGSVLTSGGTSTVPAWRAAATCTSSAATTCTITGQRAGCLPVCSMSTSVSTTFRAALSSTTITCTFGTSGTNTCNCICV